jgi:hypothetical protein
VNQVHDNDPAQIRTPAEAHGLREASVRQVARRPGLVCKAGVDSIPDSNSASSHPNGVVAGWKIHAAVGRGRTLTDALPGSTESECWEPVWGPCRLAAANSFWTPGTGEADSRLSATWRMHASYQAVDNFRIKGSVKRLRLLVRTFRTRSRRAQRRPRSPLRVFSLRCGPPRGVE